MGYEEDLPPTIQERYGNAVDATDLTMRFERGGQVDVLTAAGMVGVKHPLSMSLWRWVYGGDTNERHAVLVGLMKHMKRRSARERWKEPGKLVQVVVAVADWYLARTCPACHGTLYQVIPGTPSLSDVPCPVCHCTGEKSIDKILVCFGPDWIKRGHDLRAHMDDLIADAANGMLRKTANTITIEGL